VSKPAARLKLFGLLTSSADPVSPKDFTGYVTAYVRRTNHTLNRYNLLSVVELVKPNPGTFENLVYPRTRLYLKPRFQRLRIRALDSVLAILAMPSAEICSSSFFLFLNGWKMMAVAAKTPLHGRTSNYSCNNSDFYRYILCYRAVN
jgi:hypothetical protein